MAADPGTGRALLPRQALPTGRAVTVFERNLGDGGRQHIALFPILDGQYFLHISRPAQGLFADARLVIWLQMALPLSMWLLAVFAAWLAVDRLVLRWLRAQRRVVRAYADGHLDQTLDSTHAPEEFRAVGTLLNTMAERIAEREAALKAALDEKDLLIKEIHHRVKNNLQIVTSLLNLHGRKLPTEEQRQILKDAQTRIDALAAIHRTLYEAEDLRWVKLRPFFASLTREFTELADSADRHVRIPTELPDIWIAADKAIPLALLATEAVTNAIQHAFETAPDGEVSICIERDDSEDQECYTIAICDDGRGYAPGSDDAKGAGIGKTLMQAFARQLGGRLTVETGETGTCIRVSGAILN